MRLAGSVWGFLQDLWKLFSLEALKRTFQKVQKDNVMALAAQLAYYSMLALFPFILVLVALMGTFSSPKLATEVLGYFNEVLPTQVYALMETYTSRVLSGENPAPSLLSFGIIGTIWAASGAFGALINALNKAYEVQETRPFWKVQGMAILMTIGLSGFVLLAVVLLIGGSALGSFIADFLGLGYVFQFVWGIIRWPAALLFLVIAIALMYYIAPAVKQPFRWITPGGLIAVLLWVLASVAFSFYVNNFGSYDRVYGSIGVVIVLLLYLYISSLTVLLGAELNATLVKMKEEASGKQILEGKPETC